MKANHQPASPDKSRRGTVLIMVVGLLVVLAVMGMAWLATTRLDRTAAAQNTENTRLDLLTTSVRDQVLGEIADGLKRGGPRWNRWSITSGVAECELFDCPLPAGTTNNDHAGDWLASRVPIRPASLEEDPNNPKGYSTAVLWPAVSTPIASQSPGSGATVKQAVRQFAAPLCFQDASLDTEHGGHLTATRLSNERNYVQRVDVKPSAVLHNGEFLPAFERREEVPANSGNWVYRYYVAADTDNDGIADAGLWRLPIPEHDGITWYAAHRIIDNTSAINVNVAWASIEVDASGPNYLAPAPSKLAEFRVSGGKPVAPYLDLFPSNIDLVNLLRSGSMLSSTQMDRLNALRRGGATFNLNTDPINDNNPALPTNFRFLSEYEAIWNQLGRRVDNPGFVDASLTRAKAFTLGDQAALARRFVLSPASVNDYTLLERVGGNAVLWETLRPETSSSNYPNSYGPAFCPNNRTFIDCWFDNFDYFSGGMIPFSRRPLLVTHNGVSNRVADAEQSVPSPLAPDHTPPGSAMTTKTNVNVGDFQSLYRAFWNAMVDPKDANLLPFVATNPDDAFEPYKGNNTLRMFRSSMRHHDASPTKSSLHFLPTQQLLLRSAIAAANAVQMRAGGTRYIEQTVALQAKLNNADTQVTVTIYPNRPQPYITEVYYQNDDVGNGGANPMGYLAIELYNPTGEDIDMADWKLVAVNRPQDLDPHDPADVMKLNASSVVASFAEVAGTVVVQDEPNSSNPFEIPAGGYVVIENYSSGGTATVRPPSANWDESAGPIHKIYIKDLDKIVGKELTILRPTIDGTPVADSNAYLMVPVDQYDLTGMTTRGGTGKAQVWHYRRGSGNSADRVWKCVYPGTYDGALSSRRQSGTDHAEWDPLVPEDDPWKSDTTRVLLGKDSAPTASRSFKIPLAFENYGPNGNATPPTFPFGGFARDGDILQIPFVGAYTVYEASTGDLLEINAVTMDSVFAEDSFSSNDADEQVGRFMPLKTDGTDLLNYAWTKRILDVLTVQSPHDDYMANAPREFIQKTYGINLANPEQAKNQAVANFDPLRRNGIDASVNPAVAGENRDGDLGVEGLININTAPWKVLAMVPFIPKHLEDSSASPPRTNEYLAQAIVRYRDIDDASQSNPPFTAGGPFRSLWDLYKVPEFQQVQDYFLSLADPDDDLGDITPLGQGTTDGIRGDFEERSLLLTRVSNMLTTRSDTFTAYILLEGWRNVGTADAQRVYQRRMGMIIDRAGVDSTNPHPKFVMFPVD